MYNGSDMENPAYVLGFKIRSLLKVSIVFTVSFAAFLVLVRLAREYTSNGQSNLLFTVAPGIAGVVQILFLLDTFVMLFTGLAALLSMLLYFRVGNMLFYDDHVLWKRPRKSRTLNYDELTDAYFGYVSMHSASNYSVGRPSYNFSRQISFYIDNRRFAFTISMNKHAGIDEYLESRIPKKNIDVEDDE